MRNAKPSPKLPSLPVRGILHTAVIAAAVTLPLLALSPDAHAWTGKQSNAELRI